MHAGQLATIKDVLEHYNKVAKTKGVSREIAHGRLSEEEMHQIEEFLMTLEGEVIAP